MSTRMNIVMSDDLNGEIERVAAETQTTKSEILRKALQLYLVAVDGKKRNLKIGLVHKDQQMETEFIGL